MTAVGDARKRHQEAQAPLSQPIPAAVDSGAIGRPNEAERALHVMRWTYEDGGARAEAVCLAGPDADCRLVGAGPECSCEWWGRIERRDDGTIWHLLGELDGKGYVPQPSDWHQVIPQDDCSVCLFINESGCAEELTPDGEHHRFVIADVPFDPVWENDGCSWRPKPIDLAAIRREHTDRALAEVEQRLAKAWDEGYEKALWAIDRGMTPYEGMANPYRAARQEQGR